MVFRYNQPEGIATLDPAFAKNQAVIWATHQLFNSLTEVHPDSGIRPSLARSWTLSSDRLTYTFSLRRDVRFHDHAAFPGGRGRRMVASDVAYSLARILDPATASPGAWIFNGRVDSLHPFSAPDDSTFILRLRTPFPPILGILSMQYCSIVPREVVQALGRDFGRSPCGTGPFRFGRWEEGLALILLRNTQYFERDNAGHPLPYLDAVKVSFLDNKAAEFLEFRQGRLDFVNDIDANFKDEVLSRDGSLKDEWKGRIVLQKHAYMNTEYLGILQDTSSPLLQGSPLRSLRVRLAMSHAIDRRRMMLYLRNSIGFPAINGFVPYGLPGFDRDRPKGHDYDPALARRLLAEAGYPGGRGMEPFTLYTIPIYAEMGAFVARQLEEIGIPVRVEAMQRGSLLERMSRRQALFFRGSWIADYPDAENYLGVFYGANPAPPNYTRTSIPAFDVLYRQALGEADDSTRFAIYRRMDQMVID
ncbi:MAG: ABC transporter substrate-binding protein, partial [Chitinophagia bacterium]|nr:ABC transporter substrate-binding protein [Chitinophagia bacterium]